MKKLFLFMYLKADFSGYVFIPIFYCSLLSHDNVYSSFNVKKVCIYNISHKSVPNYSAYRAQFVWHNNKNI